MAQQDFAKIEVLADEPDEDVVDERPVPQRTILFSIVLAVALVMVALAAGFWMGKKQGLELASSQDKARLQALIEKQREELENLRAVAKQQAKVEAPTTQVGDLTFYNDLPNQEVSPSALHAEPLNKPEADKSKLEIRDMIQQEMRTKPMIEKTMVKPRTPVSTAFVKKVEEDMATVAQVSYQIQVASFQNVPEAQRFMTKLKKHGFSARMQEVKLPKLGVWHRVYTGHYASKEQAQKDMRLLQEKLHVTGLVVRL